MGFIPWGIHQADAFTDASLQSCSMWPGKNTLGLFHMQLINLNCRTL